MIAFIRIAEQIMGDGLKSPRLSEISNIEVARKSIVAAKDIREGDLFTKENLVLKRPGSGRSPMDYLDMLGEIRQKDYYADDPVKYKICLVKRNKALLVLR